MKTKEIKPELSKQFGTEFILINQEKWKYVEQYLSGR